MGKYFGTDGIRGKAELFTSDFIERIVAGLGVSGKRVMIGGDTRESTKRILDFLERSLNNQGASEVGNVGVFPTPGINFAFYYLGYDFAIDVTASHNPYTDNGIKIFERGESSGVKLSAQARDKIEQSIADEFMALLNPSETRYLEDHNRALGYYLEHLADYVGDVDLSGMTIALDCANGATGVVASQVFEKLGAEVEAINNDTQFGTTINAGVGSTHIEGLQELVTKSERISFGAAFDGDGDRCMLVDEKGGVVDGDQILAILAKHLGLKAIVATVMANQGLLNWGEATGIKVVTSDVGDQNVAIEMKKHEIQLGGEQSGHIILPGEAMGDGTLTALMIAKVMRESGKSLSELTSEMKKTPQILLNIPAEPEEKAKLDSVEVQKVVAEYEKELEKVHGRVLVRPSGTENLIRITTWGDDREQIEKIASELADKLKEVLK